MLNNNISINGKCGNSNGKCSSDQCCSQRGWCGETNDFCDITRGCQPELGRCGYSNKISTNEKCGGVNVKVTSENIKDEDIGKRNIKSENIDIPFDIYKKIIKE
ncbi:carbohydrate-binding module family 18 protein [Piromyces sp. E2]|nr:carbohydrate-binding module family 18 protein [Piromyces sp. E2]|eukprot:OUM59926.1 carbohydrate-binding module family 18 protein [Piromyces sp. E2]